MTKPFMLYASAATLLFGLFAGWSVRDWKADADTLRDVQKREALKDRMQSRIDAQASAYEQARADNMGARVETTNTIREVYRNVEVPAACAAPDAVVGLLGRAVDRANDEAAGKPVAAVPAAPATPDPAHRP